MSYREERKRALIRYLKKTEKSYQMDGTHDHVLDMKFANANVVQSVKNGLKYEIRKNEKGTITSLSNGKHSFKLDWRANNLTSSSMLSACFFAYCTENQPFFKNWIVETFQKEFGQIVSIKEDIKVELEWYDKEGDKSHIDALITFDADGKHYRIFVEVKYCEPAYGPKKSWVTRKMDEQQKQEAQKEYIESCKKCFDYHKKRLSLSGFMDGCDDDPKDYEQSKYCQRYQIIRNVSHASLGTNDYCWFLLAEGNKEAVKDISDGLKDLCEQNGKLCEKRVAIVYLEDLLKDIPDLYQKYFGK
jgi:hypothetical protein